MTGSELARAADVSVAENVLCATCVQEPGRWREILAMVEPADLTDRVLARIAAAAKRIVDGGGAADRNAIYEHVKNDLSAVEWLEEVDGVATCGGDGWLRAYCQQVRDGRLRREVAQTAIELHRAAQEPDGSLVEIGKSINRLRTSLVALDRLGEGWPLECMQINDLLDTEPEPYEYIIDGLLTKGVVGVIYGEGGSAKTLATLWLSVRLATAGVAPGKWLGRFAISQPRRVLYVCLEDLRVDTHHRLRAIVGECLRGDAFTTPCVEAFRKALTDNFLMLGRETIFADDPETLLDANAQPTAKFERLLRTVENLKPDVVFLDTWSKASRTDENENAIQAADVAAWTYLRDRTGSAVILLAHCNKNGRGTDTGQSGLRGASARTDELRFVLNFRSATPTSDGSQVIEIVNQKNTRCRLSPRFKVVLRYPVFEAAPEVSENAAEMVDRAIAWVRGNPGRTQRDAIAALGGRAGSVNEAFRVAVADHAIERRQGGYHAL